MSDLDDMRDQIYYLEERVRVLEARAKAAEARAERAEADRDGLRYTNEILASGVEDLKSELEQVKGQKALFVKAVNEQGQRIARVRELRDYFLERAERSAEPYAFLYREIAGCMTEALEGGEDT